MSIRNPSQRSQNISRNCWNFPKHSHTRLRQKLIPWHNPSLNWRNQYHQYSEYTGHIMHDRQPNFSCWHVFFVLLNLWILLVKDTLPFVEKSNPKILNVFRLRIKNEYLKSSLSRITYISAEQRNNFRSFYRKNWKITLIKLIWPYLEIYWFTINDKREKM